MEAIKEQITTQGISILTDLGGGILIAKADIKLLREQDVNARIMKDDKFNRLVSNIKLRGGLESLPLCVFTDGRIEIISGHHRVKASREAGLKEIPFMLDISGLSRSQIAAKQLAHNAISGVDDQDTIKEILRMIDNVDDMLESAMDKDLFSSMEQTIDSLKTPAIDFEWKTIQFTFLPHQLADFRQVVENSPKADYEGVAALELFEPFVKAMRDTQKFDEVKSVGTAIYVMTKAALDKLEVAGYSEDPDMEWESVSKIIGGSAIPKESAKVIALAIKKMQDAGEVSNKNKWEALEYMAANYLAE